MRRYVLPVIIVGLFFIGIQSVRIIQKQNASYMVYPPNFTRNFFLDDVHLPGVGTRASYSTNSVGVIGSEIPSGHVYRIITMGGSTTENLYVDQKRSWPSLLETNLNTRNILGPVWIGNIGRSGMTSRNHVLEMVTMIPQLSVDAIILLPGVNDFQKVMTYGSSFSPMSIPDIIKSDKLLNETFSYYPAVHKGVIPLFAHVMHRMYLSLRNFGNALVFREYIDSGARYIERERGYRAAATHVIHELPDLASALSEYRNNLIAIISRAKERNIRIILMTQPFIWRSDLPGDIQRLLWFGGVGNTFTSQPTAYYSVSAMADGMRQYNAVVLGVCANEHVECIDLEPYMPKDTSVFYDDVHFNDYGSEVVAGVISEYISTKRRTPERVSL